MDTRDIVCNVIALIFMLGLGAFITFFLAKGNHNDCAGIFAMLWIPFSLYSIFLS